MEFSGLSGVVPGDVVHQSPGRGESSGGDWTLTIRNQASIITGTLNS